VDGGDVFEEPIKQKRKLAAVQDLFAATGTLTLEFTARFKHKIDSYQPSNVAASNL